ncbi:MAG: thiamine-phosphate pyrophosphorylase [Bacteroidetes bacterium]|uniref:thiamine phosphate synthase n=1 Tax=unclassified Chitinophaga TaxID=2619133 RepID=UPI0009D397B9|nr:MULTISPECIES: thiamine phosphate synthase [unclassified Chitinophaga]MBP1652756.1 thiamine-phosphate pyrophosphorylase [Bacteroidota bacterium]OMP77350.1 thiamine-phosphate diphosphorylase [[Flexibacter] sp. ATCC 35208]WPV67201.1 thiamine phosphate synthase [Chitinophaga sp. LS1]
MFNRRLYLVISEEACKGRDLVAVAKAAVKGGVDLIQLREKQLDNPAFLERALRLKEALIPHRVPLIINDNLWVAQQCGATGIHVGNSDLAPLTIMAQWPSCGILGYSIEYEKQIYTADAVASDYLALSPIFATPTKTDTVTEWKLEGIRHIRALTDKLLVAIGAIHEGNAADVIKAGADCLAIVSAICGAPDPEKAAAAIRLQIEKAL